MRKTSIAWRVQRIPRNQREQCIARFVLLPLKAQRHASQIRGVRCGVLAILWREPQRAFVLGSYDRILRTHLLYRSQRDAARARVRSLRMSTAVLATPTVRRRRLRPSAPTGLLAVPMARRRRREHFTFRTAFEIAHLRDPGGSRHCIRDGSPRAPLALSDCAASALRLEARLALELLAHALHHSFVRAQRSRLSDLCIQEDEQPSRTDFVRRIERPRTARRGRRPSPARSNSSTRCHAALVIARRKFVALLVEPLLELAEHRLREIRAQARRASRQAPPPIAFRSVRRRTSCASQRIAFGSSRDVSVACATIALSPST